MNYISEKGKTKTTKHFAALVFTSIYIEGDERSRSAPGHGYPAHHESVVNYIAFDTKEEMEAWVDKQEHPTYGNPNKNYIVAEIHPLTVTTKTSVEINTP